MSKAVLFAVTAVLIPAVSPAAPFTLGAVLRAGNIFSDNLRLGTTSSATSTSAGLFPYWLDGVDHSFQLSYNASTNLATLTASWLGIFASGVSYSPAGGVPGSAPRLWTIDAGGIKLTALNASPTNTSVRLQNLTITGAGLGVISTPNLIAAQTGSGTVTAANSTPITFATPNGGGSWILNGQVQFAGLYGSPAATGDALRLAFDFLSTEVPEPSTLLMGALGFAALGVVYGYRLRRIRQRSNVGRRAATGSAPGAAS